MTRKRTPVSWLVEDLYDRFPERFRPLLELGEANGDDILHVLSQIRGPDPAEDARVLAMIAAEPRFLDTDGSTTLGWATSNAMLALARLGPGAEAAVDQMGALLADAECRDDIADELPGYFAAVGLPALDAAVKVLNNADLTWYPRALAAESIGEIAGRHPELRPEAIRILDQTLIADTDPDLVGEVVTALLDLNSRESIPLIQQAFDDGRVSEDIVQMADVEEFFDLPRMHPRSHIDWPPALGVVWHEAPGLDAEHGSEPDHDAERAASPEAAGAEDEPRTPYIAPYKVGRNEPCPCGSGRKYKKCCGT